MLYSYSSPGFHLIHRDTHFGVGQHYGILVVGREWVMALTDGQLDLPLLVIDFSSEGLKIREFLLEEGWELEGKVLDDNAAYMRTKHLMYFGVREYRLSFHNCEHPARFIAYGKAESKQLQFVAGMVLATGVVLWANATDNIKS